MDHKTHAGQRRGNDLEFAEMVAKLSKTREDIYTWFDFLDLDDYCSFGGRA